MTKAHYLWIGPPPDGKRTPFGHDIAAVRNMADVCDSEVTLNFWCIREHVEHYREVLADRPNIRVCCIDTYLARLAAPDEFEAEAKLSEEDCRTAKLASRIIKALGKLLDRFSLPRSEGPNTTRNRVTAKELISFFLLYYEGGYVLDSNVRSATKDKPVTLIDYDEMAIPSLFRKDGETERRKDGWLMYSPQFNRGARRALKTFLAKVSTLLDDKAFLSEKAYHDQSQRLFMQVINRIRKVTPIKADRTYTLADLNLQKLYFNTHYLKKTPLLVMLISTRGSAGLESYLEFKNPVNLALTVASRFIDATPLLIAILVGSFEKFELLAPHTSPEANGVLAEVNWATLYKHKEPARAVREHFQHGTSVELLVTAPMRVIKQLPDKMKETTVAAREYWTKHSEMWRVRRTRDREHIAEPRCTFAKSSIG